MDTYTEIMSLLAAIHLRRPDFEFISVIKHIQPALNDKEYAKQLREYYKLAFTEKMDDSKGDN